MDSDDCDRFDLLKRLLTITRCDMQKLLILVLICFFNTATVTAVRTWDGRADVGIFRQDSNTWYLLQSTAGFTSTVWGFGGDKPVPSAFVP